MEMGMIGVRMTLCSALLALTYTLHAAEFSAPADLGRQLFEENWLTPPADDSPLAVARGGDGIGPLFNGGSCASCHYQGGIGGAGANDTNIEILSLVLPLDTPPAEVRNAARIAARFHPGFRDSTNVFLHRFGQDADGSLETYRDYRSAIRSQFPEDLLPADATQTTLEGNLNYQLAQRSAPALFGASLIDEIDPATLRDIAAAQKRLFPNIAGRVSENGTGRFGWRGHITSLEDFVRTACTVELGMRVKSSENRALLDQPRWPVDTSLRSRERRSRADLSEPQVEALVAFVRSLPAPEPQWPDDADNRQRALHGQQVFSDIGCTVCHQPDIGGVKNVYSDLLLHDMGPSFADRVAAPLPPAGPQGSFAFMTFGPGKPPQFESGNFSGFGPANFANMGGGKGNFEALQKNIESIAAFYSGASLTPLNSNTKSTARPSLEQLTAATQEFRTPPLWGVAESAPYLHDGRAPTLDDAIRFHTGQAQTAAFAYQTLPQASRDDLLTFLRTLKAPPMSK